MRRFIVLFVVTTTILLFVPSVAFAARVVCPSRGATCVGTNQPDLIQGSDRADNIDAKQDDDIVRGRDGEDKIFADAPSPADTRTDGDDEVNGGQGADTITVFGGNDIVLAGFGADVINAEEQSNNPGQDSISGGPGNDKIFARDQAVDVIICGGGIDTVFFDKGIDRVSASCEDQNPLTTAAAASPPTGRGR